MKFTIDQEKTTDLIQLLMTCDFDYSRIIIAEHEIASGALTLYLEDKNDFKDTLDQCIEVIISKEEFAKFIAESKYNSYHGHIVKDSGKILPSDIEIDAPLAWYENDASEFERTNVREDLVKELLVNLTK